ncbi:hypothetical protein WA158_003834 [Blastocystis sp. Blastoise]
MSHYTPQDVQCNQTIVFTHNHLSALTCKPGTVVINDTLSYSLKTQNQLSLQVNLCESQFLGTHNSAISAAYGYGTEDGFLSLLLYVSDVQLFKVHTLNQYLSITDQLNLGIRVIEIDVHFVYDSLRIAHCGGFSSPFLNYIFAGIETLFGKWGFKYDSETIGCFPSFSGIPYDDQIGINVVLQEIHTWLFDPKNNREFLILYLDDYENIERWKLVQQLQEEILHYIPITMIILPQEMDTSLPLQYYVQQGKRVMIVSRFHYTVEDDASSHNLYQSIKQFISSPFSSSKHKQLHKNQSINSINIFFFRGDHNTCYWNEPSLNTYSTVESCPNHNHTYSRVGCNVIRYGPVNSRFLPKPDEDTITVNNINTLFDCGVNTVGIDLHSLSYAQQSIWTWDLTINFQDYKSQSLYYCTSISTSTFRWFPMNCSTVLPALCRHTTNQSLWTIGQVSKYPTNDISNIYINLYIYIVHLTPLCPDEYIFSVPYTHYQNSVMKKQLEDVFKFYSFLWINWNFTKFFEI